MVKIQLTLLNVSGHETIRVMASRYRIKLFVNENVWSFYQSNDI